MLAIAPDATLVDVSHRVPPQDVASGAYVLSSAYRYFPAGTVHLAVVDPGRWKRPPRDRGRYVGSPVCRSGQRTVQRRIRARSEVERR